MHTNAEDLEMLINNLEHDFSVIALSETWTSKQEINCSQNLEITNLSMPHKERKLKMAVDSMLQRDSSSNQEEI